MFVSRLGAWFSRWIQRHVRSEEVVEKLKNIMRKACRDSLRDHLAYESTPGDLARLVDAKINHRRSLLLEVMRSPLAQMHTSVHTHNMLMRRRLLARDCDFKLEKDLLLARGNLATTGVPHPLRNTEVPLAEAQKRVCMRGEHTVAILSSGMCCKHK